MSPHTAYLTHDQTLYFATGDVRPGCPHSPVTTLIQGIYQRYPRQALRMVRERIFYSGEPTAMCRGMVRVAAARMTAPTKEPIMPSGGVDLSEPNGFHDPAQLASWPLDASKPECLPKEPRFRMELAMKLAASVPRDTSHKALYECDRAIASILVSETGALLAWGRNANARNKTLHAEVNMLQSYFALQRDAIPRGSIIYTTRKPCRMCAGMIWHSAQDVASLKVYYLEHDPGPMARATVLNAGSHDRKEVAGSGNVDVSTELEWQLSV